VTIYVPVSATGEFSILARVTAPDKPHLLLFEDTVKDLTSGTYRKVVPLAPGSYTLWVILEDHKSGDSRHARREIQVGEDTQRKLFFFWSQEYLQRTRKALADSQSMMIAAHAKRDTLRVNLGPGHPEWTQADLDQAELDFQTSRAAVERNQKLVSDLEAALAAGAKK